MVFRGLCLIMMTLLRAKLIINTAIIHKIIPAMVRQVNVGPWRIRGNYQYSNYKEATCVIPAQLDTALPVSFLPMNKVWNYRRASLSKFKVCTIRFDITVYLFRVMNACCHPPSAVMRNHRLAGIASKPMLDVKITQKGRTLWRNQMYHRDLVISDLKSRQCQGLLDVAVEEEDGVYNISVNTASIPSWHDKVLCAISLFSGKPVYSTGKLYWSWICELGEMGRI